MINTNTVDVVIAGAGIGGLTTALALHARGIDTIVLETAREIRSRGVGINIQPAAIAELTALGLGDALAATGIPTREHRYLDHTGAVLWTEPRGVAAGYDHPQYSIHRGELQMLLLTAVLDRLGPDAVRAGTRLTTFENHPTGVRVHARDRVAGSAVVFEATVLIGADGLHSIVRSRLHPGEDALHPAGVQMWRGLTELDGFLDGRTMILANDRRGARIIAYPCSARHAARNRVLLNWVCMVPDLEAGRTDPADWTSLGRPEEFLPHFEHWDFGWLKVSDMLTQSPNILRYPMVDRNPLTGWGRGRVTLLGDAAHLMYPIGANGGTQAILDAVALAAALSRRDGVESALREYEDFRRPPTTAIIYANRKMDHSERVLAERPAPNEADTIAAVAGDYRAVVDRKEYSHERDFPRQTRSGPAG